MNAKERQVVSEMICITEREGVDIEHLVSLLLASDKKLLPVLKEWQGTYSDSESYDDALENKYDELMTKELGFNWSLNKRARFAGEHIWAEAERQVRIDLAKELRSKIT